MGWNYFVRKGVGEKIEVLLNMGSKNDLCFGLNDSFLKNCD